MSSRLMSRIGQLMEQMERTQPYTIRDLAPAEMTFTGGGPDVQGPQPDQASSMPQLPVPVQAVIEAFTQPDVANSKEDVMGIELVPQPPRLVRSHTDSGASGRSAEDAVSLPLFSPRHSPAPLLLLRSRTDETSARRGEARPRSSSMPRLFSKDQAFFEQDVPRLVTSPRAVLVTSPRAEGVFDEKVTEIDSAPQPTGQEGGGRCYICLDDLGQTTSVTGLCGAAECSSKGSCCKPCFQKYLASAVEGSRFAVIPVKCPAEGCGRRIATQRWRRFAKAESVELYEQSARDCLSLRCPGCDSTVSLLEEAAPEELEVGREVFKTRVEAVYGEDAPAVLAKLKTTWMKFREGKKTADEFLEHLLSALGHSSVEELEHPEDVYRLIPDVQPRCALQLAVLRRQPKITTPCCFVEFCFACQLSSHHDEKTCEEMRQQETGVDCQFCPSCGVATQRTEGCSHIRCLCGADWSWEGSMDVFDPTEEEDRHEED